jgi:cysteine desulfurase
MSTIYLDHNSTTPMLPEVAAAMAECVAAGYANPASQHSAGRRTRQRLEQARDEIGRMLGVEIGSRTPHRVIFTSGGTEANNLALVGMADGTRSVPATEAIISAIEHPSVIGPTEYLEKHGWRVHRTAVDARGVVRIDHLCELLNERTRFVSMMLGNNETGVLQPVAEMATVCREVGVPIHTDAAQVAGKLPVNFCELGVAAMTVAAHKFHGPLGIGALVVRGDVQINPQMVGGFQQSGMRAGTESVALAVGMETALKAFEREQTKRIARVQTLRDRLEATLLANYPPLVINGRDAPRLPGTANMAFVGLNRQQLFLALDMAGVCCSTGSACASGSSEPSPVLRAMGLPSEVVNSSLRFSLGATTTEKEIDEAARRILAVCAKMEGKLP